MTMPSQLRALRRTVGLHTPLVGLTLWFWVAVAGAQVAANSTSADDAERASICAQMNARFDVAFARSATQAPLLRLAALQRASQQIGEDPAGCVRERILAIDREARAQLIRLSADDVLLPPSAVYRCGRIGPGLRCSGWQADDSSHLAELSMPTAVPASARLRMSTDPRYHPRHRRAYLWRPSERAPQALSLSRNSLATLSLPQTAGDAHVIVIVEEASPRSFVKYVWSLRFGQLPQR
jgi:hypothetical protein